MKTQKQPGLVPTEELPSYFRSEGIAYKTLGSVNLGFGHGKDQYCLYDYPAPAGDETMGLFCEWHTEDYFDVDTGPHVAIGLRGPVKDDPHRGRGLAIGILANSVCLPDAPGQPVPLFDGCPDAPGGPSFFIEDFSGNDGAAPISDWQLCRGRHLPLLKGNGIYRIDIHVSKNHAWAGVWQVTETRSANGSVSRVYEFMDQVACSDAGPGFDGSPCPEDPADNGRGNAFIGSGFSDPETRSRVNHIYMAHWKNRV
jgi:hypothetical protein